MIKWARRKLSKSVHSDGGDQLPADKSASVAHVAFEEDLAQAGRRAGSAATAKQAECTALES